MFAQYGGPHTVTCDLSNDVYEIQLDRLRAPLHIIMLKQYINALDAGSRLTYFAQSSNAAGSLLTDCTVCGRSS